jgi:hypothetical protein
VNENRGSGVVGVVNRLGKALSIEKAKRMMRGRKLSSGERAGSSACACWPFVRVRCRVWMGVVRNPLGPNEAVKTARKFHISVYEGYENC